MKREQWINKGKNRRKWRSISPTIKVIGRLKAGFNLGGASRLTGLRNKDPRVNQKLYIIIKVNYCIEKVEKLGLVFIF